MFRRGAFPDDGHRPYVPRRTPHHGGRYKASGSRLPNAIPSSSSTSGTAGLRISCPAGFRCCTSAAMPRRSRCGGWRRVEACWLASAVRACLRPVVLPVRYSSVDNPRTIVSVRQFVLPAAFFPAASGRSGRSSGQAVAGPCALGGCDRRPAPCFPALLFIAEPYALPQGGRPVCLVCMPGSLCCRPALQTSMFFYSRRCDL